MTSLNDLRYFPILVFIIRVDFRIISVYPILLRLGRPRRKWEDNIKMDLQEVGFGGMDWIELAQDRDR